MAKKKMKKAKTRWIGIAFGTSSEFFEFHEFVASFPEDVRSILIQEEAYLVGDGPDLEAIIVGNEVVGFGVSLEPYATKKKSEANRIETTLIKHVETILASMDFAGVSEIRPQER